MNFVKFGISRERKLKGFVTMYEFRKVRHLAMTLNKTVLSQCTNFVKFGIIMYAFFVNFRHKPLGERPNNVFAAMYTFFVKFSSGKGSVL